MTDLVAMAYALDAADPLARYREFFQIPEGMIYLDGNSLGPLQRAVAERTSLTVGREWGEGLISSWDKAGWIRMPVNVGDRIASLVGVGNGEIAVGDSTSVNLFKCLAAALRLRPSRRVILAEHDNFPTDNYIVEGLAELCRDVEIRFFPSTDRIADHLADDVAVVLLSHVHYRTSKIQDMAGVTREAHARGALVVWDLSHSTGAVKVELAKSGADFAVGCTYKYLNGGPGAPAFVWVAPSLVSSVSQPLTGWMGHSRPFDFIPEYEAGAAIKRFVCGTPHVLSLSALDEALKLWTEVDLDHVFEKSRRMTELFIKLVEQECIQFGLELQSPRDASARGSHVSFGLSYGYPVMRALAANGVLGDFRAPDTMRFGFAPLYLRYSDVAAAVARLRTILTNKLWDVDTFKVSAAVT
ncbi:MULTISPECIES: kynureninase [Bradyrhizobium]|uniref:kynureninase n=1 Tax=Bradyrhizobium TaxID=374 RepID=UPI001CD1CDA8|nr:MULTISPECIES: kynureninase [Bradyrhizobium]MCA1529419.1 kynureninase [Bradyrhizobium yuanmingense]MCA1550100.1 kynureninase [Bradyrhizobium sp. BRP19]